MLPPLTDLSRRAHVVALPLRQRFRGITVREALLFEGPQGWSEFSPFTEYGDAESATWLTAAIDFAYSELPPLVRNRIAVNATLPAVAPGEVSRVLDAFPGARTVKVKVAEIGQSLDDDVARVAAVRDYLGPLGRIRLDANANWNVDEAEHAIHALAGFDLEYVEQPCASVDELADIRRRVKYMGIPIAADESVRRAEDPLEVARLGAADLLVIKAQPLGGIHAARRIIAAAGLPAVVSSALDTSVGISMGAFLAASLPELDYDCGLGTTSLLEADVSANPIRVSEGAIDVRRVEVDPDLLDRFAAPEDRVSWWLDRLARCHALLSERPAR